MPLKMVLIALKLEFKNALLLASLFVASSMVITAYEPLSFSPIAESLDPTLSDATPELFMSILNPNDEAYVPRASQASVA
jgi:hypothetical protein